MGVGRTRQVMKRKNKKTIFICQITENALKVLKCLPNHSQAEFTGLEFVELTPGIDDKKISEKLLELLEKLGYADNPFIISLPRNPATLRYLKVPAQAPWEIEKIVSLQAPRYLPYEMHELTTAYQIISTDSEGNSYINLIIVQKAVIERYLRILRDINIKNPSIILSSYGLCNLYGHLRTQDSGPVMVVDIDSGQVELAITSGKSMLSSRYFKFNGRQSGWEDLFINEINKTQQAYLKEVSGQAVTKIVVTAIGKPRQEYIQALAKQKALAIEVLSDEQIGLSQNLLKRTPDSEISFASLIGLGLEKMPESLNLLPGDIKEEMQKAVSRKGRLRLALSICGIILMLGLGLAKDLDNRAKYLDKLKIELNRIIAEAKPLEEMEKRFRLLLGHSEKRPTALGVIYQLHRLLPAEISLVSLSYEEDKEIALHGQAPELNSVFTFVGQLEKAAEFQDFNVKVRYATQKKLPAAEAIDFEIICAKK